jgi:hypothetical protein
MTPLKIPKKPKIELVQQAPDQRSFIVLPFRAATDPRLTRQLLRTLMCFASYCNRGGVAWVGHETVGRMLGIHPAVVCVYMKKLERFGYVRTVAKGFKGIRAHTRQLIFNPDIDATEACAIANDPAPFIMRQAEQFIKQKDETMPRKRKTITQDAANLKPDYQVEDVNSQNLLAFKHEVGAELFEALVQRCGKDASLDALQAELRRMLA